MQKYGEIAVDQDWGFGAGTHNVTAALSLPDGITVVGNVTVNVTITAIQQETTTESTKATESTTSATR